MGTAIEKTMRGGNVDEALAEADAAINDVIEKQSLAGTAPARAPAARGTRRPWAPGPATGAGRGG